MLSKQLEEQKLRAKELEDVNEKLTNEITALMQLSTSPLGSANLDPELELKKGIFTQILSSSSQQSNLTKSMSDYDDSGSSSNGINLKKIQQELRVSKKAEQLAKEKLSQTKRSLDKMEKDFSKYRDDSEARIETLKTELSILQKHYDQMQNSGNDIDSLVGGSSSFPFNLGNLAGTSNNSGEKQILSINRESSQQQTAAELLKVIEDYSRQNDSKTKEIEALTAKLESKHSKVRDLKKKYTETESLVTKLRATLENVKNFLKLLNSNFIKSMKQQNLQLKDSILQSQRDIAKDIDQFKGSIGTQIIRITQKKEKDIASNFYKEQNKSNELIVKMQTLKSDNEEMLEKIRKEHENEVQSIKEQHQQKVNSLKQKIKVLSDEQRNNVQQNNSVIEQLHNLILGQEKQIAQLDLQLQTDKDKHQLVITDIQRESNHKSTIIEDFKTREVLLQKKLEDQESRSRQEVEKLLSKLEIASTQGLDKSLATQLIQQKEALLAQELQIQKESHERLLQQMKDQYESKLKERDIDCDKLRLKSADDLSILKSQYYTEVKDKESQISTLQSQISDVQSRLQKKASKINSLKSDIQKNLEQYDSEKQTLRDNFNIQKIQLEQKQVQLENDVLQLTTKINDSLRKYNEIQELHNKEKDDLLKQIQELQKKIKKTQREMEIQNHEILSIIPQPGATINKHQINNSEEDMSQRDSQIRNERPSYSEPQPSAPSIQENSRGSSKEHLYEGGQDERREEQEGGGPPQQSSMPPMQALMRPPIRPQAPMSAGRGRGMPPNFRPPFGMTQGVRPTPQPRPTSLFNSNSSP